MPADPLPAARDAGGAFVLTDCVAMGAYTVHPGRSTPAPRPDGWPESPATHRTTEIGVRALRCARVSLGPFERGPVHLAFDWHNNAQAPPACTATPAEDANVLATLWTDDADLARHLRERYALPAFEAAVEEGATELAAGRLHSWSWGPDGARSELSVLGGGPEVAHADAFTAFWPDGAGVGRLSMAGTATSLRGDRPAQGSMQPPMIAGDFVGVGRWSEGLEAAGALALFRDSGCGEAA